jgi:hypothetical protein
MVRRSRHNPAHLAQKRPVWHAIGAALGAFAMGVQLILAGWLIAQAAAAAPDLQADVVICAHEGASGSNPGAPIAPGSHGQCAVCACLQSAKILAPPPEAPRIVLLPPHREIVAVVPVRSFHVLHVHSPYASRAPPVCA